MCVYWFEEGIEGTGRNSGLVEFDNSPCPRTPPPVLTPMSPAYLLQDMAAGSTVNVSGRSSASLADFRGQVLNPKLHYDRISVALHG